MDIKHIAFIPDGNRRWAKNKSLPSLEGHRRGYDLFKKVANWCLDRDINQMSLWGFSTENWKRSKEEVGYLMDLFLNILTKDLEQFAEKEIRFRIIGRRDDLSSSLQKAIDRAEESTKRFTGGQVNLCFNYGGRAEIIDGVKNCIASGMRHENITEEIIAKSLWTADLPDIDLIIRTSGEHRLSGFMPWLGAYSELYFADMHWPDFSEEELEKAIDYFKGCERRFGGNIKP